MTKNKYNLVSVWLVPVFFLLSISIVNMYGFKQLQSNTTHHYRAIHPYDTSDIIKTSEPQMEITHSLYITLAQYTNSPVLIVPENHILSKKGNNYRARVLGMGQVELIKEKEYDSTFILNSIDKKVAHSITGEVWDWPGPARAGKPGITWELLLNTEEPENLILLIQDGEPRWTLIDIGLLEKSLQPELIW